MTSRVFKILSFLICLGIFVGLFIPALSYAGESVKGFRTDDRPLPRFVSLRSNKVYVRAGPALRYPIKWIYKREGMPVEVIQEFENWRKVKAFDEESGWIHQSLLSGERTVLIKQAEDLVPMREGFNQDSRMIARLEPYVVAELDRCTDAWCRIETGGYSGWVKRNFLWGIYENEYLN